MLVGLISDTHGYLNPAVYHEFAEVDHIIHAGDVGEERILDELATIAPVSAVSGNVDGSPTVRMPLTQRLDLGGVGICVTHGHMLDQGDYNGSAVELFRGDAPRIIVHGHSHVAKNEDCDGVAIINPGAACRPRFLEIPSIALLDIQADGRFACRFVTLARAR